VAAAGNRVEGLHRVAMGGLVLGEGVLADLPEGEWREISAEVVAELRG